MASLIPVYERWISLVVTFLTVNSQGNYLAELHAIYHAITAVPVGRSILIQSDALAAIVAIRQYGKHVVGRRRLRMAGRPLLALIQRAINDKQETTRESPHKQQNTRVCSESLC